MNLPTQRAANNPLSSTSESELRADIATFARSHLTEAMVPTRFVILEKLPKLPNGKVDRNQLPKVDVGKLTKKTYLPPSTPEEVRLAEIWQDMLGVDQVGIEDSFFELGGNSLTVAQMVAKVKEEFGVVISLRQLFKHPTISELVRMMGVKAHVANPSVYSSRSVSSKELVAEAQLPSDITPDENAATPIFTEYRSIFLTGGTGYTGAFLLSEILEQSDAKVYVLIRAKDAFDAANRVKKNMIQYGLWQNAYEQRLMLVVGDLSHSYFGVTRPIYEHLVDQVEMIVHNGALSSYALPYRQLKPINVLGTQEILRLACRRRIKPVHFVSSLAVFPGYQGVQNFPEVEITDPEGVVGGYRQTKWVADRLISLAGQRGLPVCIYRPGLITGAQTTGVCSTDTFLNAVMKGCIQLAAALDFNVMLEMVPVDFCAKAITHIALSGQRHNMYFHLPSANSMRWSELIDILIEYGYLMRRIPYKEWYRELSLAVEQEADNALNKFFPLFEENAPSEDVGYPGSQPHFQVDNLMAAIAGSGIELRPMDKKLLFLYFDHFVSTGYFQPPAR